MLIFGVHHYRYLEPDRWHERTPYALGRDSTMDDTALWAVNPSNGAATRRGHFGSAATIISLAATPG